MKTFLRLSPIAIALFFIGVEMKADASQIANWVFETSQPSGTGSTNGPYSPETGSGTATGSHASASTVWSAPSGNGSVNSFSSNNWSVGDYYQFEVDASHFSGLQFAWDQTSSTIGPGYYTLQYSTDGTNFTTFYSYSVGAVSWSQAPLNHHPESSLSQDLSTVTALDGAATAYFRIRDDNVTSANGSTTNPAGTDRIDNVIISGTVPEPSAIVLAALGILGVGWFALPVRSLVPPLARHQLGIRAHSRY